MAQALNSSPSDRRGAYLLLLLAIIILGFGLIAYGYWPGIIIDDARWQYQQAVDNAFEDWHPPLMAWVWRRVMFIQPGPAPMLLLQLGLYWTGIGLLATWAYRRRPAMGAVLACVGLIPAPFALTGTITKDCLMAGLLACAAGLLVWRDFAARRPAYIILTCAIVVLILLAAALRFNAFLACVPLALAAAPRSLRSSRLRFASSALCASAICLLVGPTINMLVHAQKMDTQYSLIIFDLGGITEHSGKNAFPEMGVKDPVAVNHRCYNPQQWDGYSSWARKPCALGFDAFQARADKGEFNPISVWGRAVIKHPLAYAAHRLSHFNASTWFLVGESPRFTAWSQSVPNPWGYQVQSNAVLDGTTRIANDVATTPFGWPIFWISLGAAALFVSIRTALSPATIAIAASAALYGAGYLPFGVATGMRYHFWTITGAAIAAVIVGGELSARNERLSRRDMLVALSIIGCPLLLALAARLGA